MFQSVSLCLHNHTNTLIVSARTLKQVIKALTEKYRIKKMTK